MKRICNSACTGCSACVSICPVNAVSIGVNTDGFYESHINDEKCIDCGKCVSKCPVNYPQYKNNDTPKCWAFMADDETRKKSSSGGFFTVLANLFLSRGGYVVGAVYESGFLVKHEITNEPDRIEYMKGSKYIQSNCSDVFPLIKDVLDKEYEVLFTGMPCQIAGLYAAVGYDYDNLYTCELVCHGITSSKVFDKYCNDIFGNVGLEKIDFKKKTPWGWHAGINAEFADGSMYSVPAEKDPYFKAYLNGISKSLACGSCVFNSLPRQADMTMGDFWRIDRYSKELNDNLGTSVVLANNGKGEKLLSLVRKQNKYKLFTEVPFEYAVAGNKSLEAPYKLHFRRKKFFEELNDIKLDKLVDHCERNKFDFGIVGLWYGFNYGSILTYYALGMLLRELGFDALFVNKPDFIWSKKYEDPNSIAQSFIRKHFSVSEIHEYERYRLLNDHCDGFIVGSDVVWNYNICGKEAQNYFFLDFADQSKKKISMASSFGGDYTAPEEDRYMNQEYLHQFDGVSVREDRGLFICKEFFGVDAKKVLDPVFLCDKTEFTKLIDYKSRDYYEHENYIMTYLLGGGEVNDKLVIQIADYLRIKKLINVPNPNNPGAFKTRYPNLTPTDVISVEQWISYLEYSDFFIGDSFHGLCFSIILGKPFICVVSKRMPSVDRFETLLSICGLENRLWYSEEDNRDKFKLLKETIDYDEVYRRLEVYKVDSLNWLQSLLKEEKIYTENENDRRFISEYDFLAKAAVKNAHGRTIITWGESKPFEKSLESIYEKRIPFWIAKNLNLVDGKRVGNQKDIYYIVVPENEFKESDKELFESMGYVEGRDYIYRKHKPINQKDILKYRDYFDSYSNKVVLKGGKDNDFEIKGFNNNLIIGSENKFIRSKVTLSGNNKVVIGNNNTFIDISIACIGPTKKNEIVIGNNCRFDGGKVRVWGFGDKDPNINMPVLKIGNGSTFGNNLTISVNMGCRAVIGNDCMFSYDVSLFAGDGHAIFDVNSGERTNYPQKAIQTIKYSIELENHVWVGKNAFVLNGTYIGSGSIIGAMSLVKGTYPNNCIIAGNPSKIVKKDIAWARNGFSEDISSCGEGYYKNTEEIVANNNKKVLILGGSGRMSSKLTELCMTYGDDVTIANRGLHEKNAPSYPVHKLFFDRFNCEETEMILKNTYWDIIYDCSGYAPQCVDSVLSSAHCKRYIYVSTFGVYAKYHKGRNVKECDLEICNSEYSDFKLYPKEWTVES